FLVATGGEHEDHVAVGAVQVLRALDDVVGVALGFGLGLGAGETQVVEYLSGERPGCLQPDLTGALQPHQGHLRVGDLDAGVPDGGDRLGDLVLVAVDGGLGRVLRIQYLGDVADVVAPRAGAGPFQ